VERRVGGTTRALVVADHTVVAVRQDLKQAAVLWRGTVVPDHGDSDTQVEQAYTQSAAPSSTNAVVTR